MAVLPNVNLSVPNSQVLSIRSKSEKIYPPRITVLLKSAPRALHHNTRLMRERAPPPKIRSQTQTTSTCTICYQATTVLDVVFCHISIFVSSFRPYDFGTETFESTSFVRSTTMTTDSTTTTDSVTTDLTLFSHLIIEMRIEIWKSLLEGTRIITIDDKTRPRDRCVVVDVDAAATITRVCLPQILLQICHEAREVALKTLNAHVDVMQPAGAIFRILFNSNDTVFINKFRQAAAPFFTSGSVTPERSCFMNLRHLAIHENNFYRFSFGRDGDEAFINAIAKISSLETLSIVKSKKNDQLHIPTDSDLVKYLTEDLRKSLLTTSEHDEQFKTMKCLITWSNKRLCLEDITTPFMRHKGHNPSWNLPAIKVKTVFNIAEFSTMIDEGINKYMESLGWSKPYFVRTLPNALSSKEWIFEAEDLVRAQKTRILKEIYKSAELGMSPMMRLAAEVSRIQTEVFREREAQIEAANPRGPRRNPTRTCRGL
jgi:hypothetical protein